MHWLIDSACLLASACESEPVYKQFEGMAWNGRLQLHTCSMHKSCSCPRPAYHIDFPRVCCSQTHDVLFAQELKKYDAQRHLNIGLFKLFHVFAACRRTTRCLLKSSRSMMCWWLTSSATQRRRLSSWDALTRATR